MSLVDSIFEGGRRENDFNDAADGEAADAIDPKESGYLLMSGYAAANQSRSRGYIYWPSTDPRQEITSLARSEIRKRIHFLMGNFGFCRRLVFGMARMVGAVTPQPVTPDDSWNDYAFDHFLDQQGSPENFDRGGRFDFWLAQPQINRNRFTEGFSFNLISETPARAAQAAFYEGFQLANPSGKAGERYEDGVLADQHTKHLRYGLRNPANPEKVSTADAKNAQYYAGFENHHGIHGLSILTAAVLNMVDVVETRGFWKGSIKDHSRMGMVVEKDPTIKLGSGASGFGGAVVQTEVTTADGSKKKIAWDQVMSGQQTPRLQPGERVKVVTDDRPHPNNIEFEKAVLRDCCWAVDLPQEALCEIAGVSSAGINLVLAHVKRWILIEVRRMAMWAKKYYAVWAAKEIAAKRLPKTRFPYWKMVEWIGHPSITANESKEGRLAIVKLDSGLTTWADEWGAEGAYWKRKVRSRIREVAWAKREVNVAAEEFEVELALGECFKALDYDKAEEEDKRDREEERDSRATDQPNPPQA